MHQAKLGIADIDRLPIELLYEIFRLCEEEHGDAWSDDPKSTYKTAAAVLSSISKRWREIALGTAVLWTRVRILGPTTLAQALARIERYPKLPLQVQFVLRRTYEIIDTFSELKYDWDRISTLHIDKMTRITYLTLADDLPPLPKSLRRLRLSNMMLNAIPSLRRYFATGHNLISLEVTSCRMYQGWMRLNDIETTNAQWMTMPRLEELKLPATPLAEQIRRYLIAPNLRYSTISDLVFTRASPNHLDIRVRPAQTLYEQVDAKFFGRLFALVPETEVLTLRYEAQTDPNRASIYDFVLEALNAVEWDYPLPPSAQPHGAWTAGHQTRLPRLNNIRLRNVDVAAQSPWEKIIARHSWGAQWRTGDAVPPVPLRTVRVEGKCEPDGWKKAEQTLTALGVDVESAFGPHNTEG